MVTMAMGYSPLKVCKHTVAIPWGSIPQHRYRATAQSSKHENCKVTIMTSESVASGTYTKDACKPRSYEVATHCNWLKCGTEWSVCCERSKKQWYIQTLGIKCILLCNTHRLKVWTSDNGTLYHEVFTTNTRRVEYHKSHSCGCHACWDNQCQTKQVIGYCSNQTCKLKETVSVLPPMACFVVVKMPRR